MAADQFNAVAAVSCLIAAAATLFGLKLGLSAKIIVRIAVGYCLVLIPLTGAVTGSVQTQGVSVPWWAFGVMNAALAFFSVALTLIIHWWVANRSGG